MNTVAMAFQSGYRDKTAGVGASALALVLDKAKTISGKLADYAVPLAVATPLAAGMVAGGLHSKAESPGDVDAEEAQLRIESKEYDEAIAEMAKRRRFAELLRGFEERKRQQRDLRT
jgi:hypothetical protein